MSDQEQAQATQADASQQAQAATTQAQAASADTETISLEEARKLRQEAASLRRRTKELEAAEEQRQQANLSELEKASKQAAKLQAERDELAAKLKEQAGRLAISVAAVKLQLDPELAEQLALSRLEYDDDGQPKNVESLLKGLLAKWPQLATANGTGAALGNSQRQRQETQAVDPKNPPKLGDPGIWKR